jgi:hypothetical protein
MVATGQPPFARSAWIIVETVDRSELELVRAIRKVLSGDAPGVVVNDEVLIGAGSLVTPGKHLESGFLYRGSPAQQARALTDDERAMLRYSAQHYVRLKDRYLSPAGRSP